MIKYRIHNATHRKIIQCTCFPIQQNSSSNNGVLSQYKDMEWAKTQTITSLTIRRCSDIEELPISWSLDGHFATFNNTRDASFPSPRRESIVHILCTVDRNWLPFLARVRTAAIGLFVDGSSGADMSGKPILGISFRHR